MTDLPIEYHNGFVANTSVEMMSLSFLKSTRTIANSPSSSFIKSGPKDLYKGIRHLPSDL